MASVSRVTTKTQRRHGSIYTEVCPTVLSVYTRLEDREGERVLKKRKAGER